MKSYSEINQDFEIHIRGNYDNADIRLIKNHWGKAWVYKEYTVQLKWSLWYAAALQYLEEKNEKTD